MARTVRSALLLAASAVAWIAAPAAAQKPDEPLGELLEVLPLPETAPKAEIVEIPPPPPRPPIRPGSVVPVELPPSGATGELVYEEVIDVDAGAAPTLPPEGEMARSAAEAEADAAWAAMQERRRTEINAVESPFVDRLNAEQAARAEAAGRRFVEEQTAYEREIARLEEEARLRREEHEAAMEAHARRVAREQAEHRARVQACLAGDRRACQQ